jgi:hypothetical protein
MRPPALLLSFVLALLPGPAALADPAPPVTAPGITLNGYGILCRTGTTRREAAPDTSLGYIQIMAAMPEIAFVRQDIPARLDIHFGLIVTSDRDIAGVRSETWKPGASLPEVWYADFTANVPRARGFSFDFAHELQPGLWRMEAFDGATRLYSVEFEVRPGGDLPGLTSDCTLLS